MRLPIAFLCASILCLAESNPAPERHLEQVKWDTATERLTAVVSEGRTKAGKYVPEKLIDYEIDLSSGTLSVDNDSEHFSVYEGHLMRQIVDAIVSYAAESVLWFDATHEKKEPKREARR